MSRQDAAQGSMTAPPSADHIHIFNEYRDSDVILRTSDGKNIYSHKWLLARISSVFRTMFELPQGNTTHEAGSIQAVDVSEPAETFVDLLWFAYPDAQPPTVSTIEKCRDLIEASVKYDMGRVGEVLREIARKEALIKSNPIASWALSRRYDIQGIRGIALDELKGGRVSLIGDATVLKLLQEGHLSAIGHYNLLVELRDRPGLPRPPAVPPPPTAFEALYYAEDPMAPYLYDEEDDEALDFDQDPYHHHVSDEELTDEE